MPAISLPAAVRADKALVRQIDGFDENVQSAEEFAALISGGSAKAALLKEAAALRKRLAAALADKDLRQLAKEIAALVKDADKLADKASAANAQDIYDRYIALWTRARGLLAQALIEIGAIEPPALRGPLQKEQAALRVALDAIEKTNVAELGNIDRLEKLLPQIEAFVKRLDPVRKAGDWMRGSYLPQLARVGAAIKRIGADRCRRSLLAELDFIEVDTDKALGKGDVKAVQTRSVPKLQRIERLAARITAASPGLDRELVRLARLLTGGAHTPAAARLKALIQAKAANWPAGADADDIDAALNAYEADLGRLAAEIEKAAGAVPAKA